MGGGGYQRQVQGGGSSHGGRGGSQFDKHTMGKLKALEVEKKEAVQQDDFQRAKQIKDEIQRIKNIGSALMELEEKKQEAIRNQNYEDARIINDKIKKLRDSNGGGPNFSRGLPTTSNDYYRQRGKTPNYDDNRQEQNQNSTISPITNNNKPPKSPLIRQKQPQNPPQVRSQQPQTRQQVQQNPDDRPIHVKSTNPYEDAGQQETEQMGEQRQAQLQPLNKELRGQCSEFFQVIDEQIFRYVFSKSHANRETGLQLAREEMERSSKNREFLISAGLFLVKSTIEDKVVTVLTACLELFEYIMKKMKPQGNPNNMHCMEFILDKLTDYLGHNTPTVRNIATSLYQTFPQYQITNKELCYRFLTMSSKRQKPPKVTSARLKVLQNMVRDYQLGKNYDQLIQYAVKYVDDKNNEVRSAAMSLIVIISKEIGYGGLQGYLKNVRPQIVKNIEERIGDGGDYGQSGEDKPIRGQKEQPQKGMDRSRSKDRVKVTHNNNYQEPMETDNQFIEVNKGSTKNKQFSNSDYVCEFCQRFDKKFQDQNYRDLHLYNACPMITKCSQCGQAIEISSLTSHLVGECKNSKYFKKCPRCKEAVHQKTYKAHVESKECMSAKAPAMANRCPLCHMDTPPGVNGWKAHLIQEGCDNNPRK